MPSVQGATTLDEVKNTVGIMIKELSWLLQNLDTRNVNELNAEVIIAGSIQADKIAAGAITADKIEAGAITADKIDVDELSAITANMGKLTSGEIYGAYIATKEGVYPRSEMNSFTNEVSSYTDATKYMSMQPGFGGNPLLTMASGGYNASLGNNDGTTALSSDLDILIQSNAGGITIKCGMGSLVKVDDFYYFVDVNTGESLQQKLDDLSNRLTAIGG